MIVHCCDERRRNAVRNSPLNGIDYLEVSDDQLTLFVHLLHAAPGFDKTQVRIEGGERVRDVRVASVTQVGSSEVYQVAVEEYGDFTPYRLRLVRSPQQDIPPADFDPRLSAIEFGFKVGCAAKFDCRVETFCPAEPGPAPTIDYLAKDYGTFRRLILDRLTLLVPGWRKRSAADVGVALAELLAYVGDHLSYQQDAVATEAYLETARLRTSLRRHALLVDYRMHDGCNARTWVHVPVAAGAGPVALPRAGTRFLTRVPGMDPRIAPGSDAERDAMLTLPTVFEPLHDATLHDAHDLIQLYAWGDRRCCLPKGATSVTLEGHLPALAAGDALLLQEVLGPLTGDERDADPAHRQVVRLTSVRALSDDDATQPRVDPLTKTEITEVAWADEDALLFPLCLSSMTDDAHGADYVDRVSIARGNLVLADHGLSSQAPESLGTVSSARLHYPPGASAGCCGDADTVEVPARYRPTLANGPLTFQGTVLKTTLVGGTARTERVPFDPDRPARAAMEWDVGEALPAILELTGESDGMPPEGWSAERDLLSSAGDDPHVVVEVEHDGSATLRFGDDTHGRRPNAGTRFTTRYRVGNGLAGNVGAGAIAHIVTADGAATGAWNPLPARGGVEMEGDAVVRRRAPQAFRRQERAVTTSDYEDVTQHHAGVERAAASFRWTGSWHTVFVTVDRTGGIPMTDAFEADLGDHVDRYRMAGHDLEFNDPVKVSLEVELLVCVRPGYFRTDVRAGLLEALSNRVLPDGRLGPFHPDRLSFGQTVYLSPIYAAARQVAGVASVEAKVFQRQGQKDNRGLVDGYLELSRLEIPRLDNDPNYPEHGELRLVLYGGK